MPAAGAVIELAQNEGRARSDITPMDFPLIQRMLGAVSEHMHAVRTELWRRYLALIVDGLRSPQNGVQPLSEPALTMDEWEQAQEPVAPPRCHARWSPPGRLPAR